MWIGVGAIGLIVAILSITLVAQLIRADRPVVAVPTMTRPSAVTSYEPSPSDSPSPTPSDSPTPAPTHSATPRHSPSPTTPADPKPRFTYTGRSATNNRLYNVVTAAGSLRCSYYGNLVAPVPDAQVKAYAERIVNCFVQALKPLLSAQGITLTVPSIRTYGADVSTPCGTIPLQRFPAFYCSTNETIYINVKTDDNRYGYHQAERGYWWMLGHEFSHHLQQRSGIWENYYQLYQRASGQADRDQLSRRVELQATCMGAVIMNGLRTGLHLSASDRFEYRDFLERYGDEAVGTSDHGSGRSQLLWFDWSYDTAWAAFGKCNTWVAPANQVS